MRVRERRSSLELTQEELALRCGLHRTYGGAVERAERNPSLATIEALAQGLGLDPYELLKP